MRETVEHDEVERALSERRGSTMEKVSPSVFQLASSLNTFMKARPGARLRRMARPDVFQSADAQDREVEWSPRP